MSDEQGAWVECDPDPRDTAILHMTPVDDCHWTRGGGVQFEPGQYVRSVNPPMDHLDLPGHREHATQSAKGLRYAVGLAEGSDEVDIRVQQGPHTLDIIGLPRIEISTGDAVR